MADGQTDSDLLTPPDGHMGQSEIYVAVAHPFHAKKSCRKSKLLNSAQWRK